MNTNTQVFRNSRLTPRAALSCTTRVNFDIHPTSIFRFVLDALSKLSPSYITNASVHTSPVTIHHLLDLQFLDSNDAKLINQFPCFLMGKIMSSIGYPLVDTRHNCLNPSSFRRSLLQLRQFSLSLGKRLLISPEKARIVNLFSRGQSGEALQPDIKPNRLVGWRQWLRFILYREASIPFIILPSDGTGTDFPEGLAMQLDFNITHLSQLEATVKTETELGIGEAVISIIPFESGIPRSLASLDSPEKGTEGFVQPVGHILKNLRVDIVKAEALFFKLRDSLALFEVGKGFLFFLPGILAFLKELIIEPAAFINLRLQEKSLMFGGIQAIFKGSFHNLNYILNEGRCQANSSPAFKSGVLDGVNL